MKKLLLTTLLIFGTAIVHGQDKMQFSIIGGYEHFKKENPHNQTARYGLGCEFKYYFYNRLYALANFHAGIYNEFTPRTAMAEVGEGTSQCTGELANTKVEPEWESIY